MGDLVVPLVAPKKLLVALLGLGAVACPPAQHGSAAAADGPLAELPGIDSSALTPREKREWHSYLTESLAPCPDLPINLHQCVAERRDCPACAPAARYLMQLVRSGRPKSQALDLFEMRFDPDRLRTIVVGDSATVGPADAPVTIVEFSDFECPSCRRMSLVLEEILALFPKKVRLVYKHYPISYHPYAEVAARAAVAAQKQGKFWPMHKACFANPDRLTDSDLRGYATAIGLDLEQFDRDFAAEHVRRQVERERKQGDGLGVRGTPTLFINGREVPLGALDDPLRDLKSWIDVELEMAGATGPGPDSATVDAGARP
ncbi:MAG: thioredoxin domain-containing protein [Deltaproteobacteria bacterium]|nr:thioredoxin domain-containing protein [Deltaproteobacteria bacterium]MBW2534201.1 thioredoxin domain-containing protein [Deltaproteobacteria bacterium]